LQPSSKTSFVILGEDAGSSKLAAIKKHGLKTVDEDGLLELIRTRDGVLDEKTVKKMKQEEEDVKKAAREIEKRETAASKSGTVM
jgi:replication factor C subunit 1